MRCTYMPMPKKIKGVRDTKLDITQQQYIVEGCLFLDDLLQDTELLVLLSYF